jgi:hypothetical protein
MANVLKKIRPRSEPPRPSSQHSLDAALEKADDARDLMEDLMRRKLPSYTGDEEESTARHEMPAQHFHVTVNNGSKPDIELEGEVEIGPVKVSGLPKWAVVAIGLVAAAIAAFVAARFAR